MSRMKNALWDLPDDELPNYLWEVMVRFIPEQLVDGGEDDFDMRWIACGNCGDENYAFNMVGWLCRQCDGEFKADYEDQIYAARHG